MPLPNPFQSYLALSQYLLILVIAIIGSVQYIKAKKGTKVNAAYVLPLGAICLIVGFLGMFKTYRAAFEMIEVVGDISPQIIANSFKVAFDYPILGILGLALSYAFKFINSKWIV